MVFKLLMLSASD